MSRENKNSTHIFFTVAMSVIMISIIATVIAVNANMQKAKAPVAEQTTIAQQPTGGDAQQPDSSADATSQPADIPTLPDVEGGEIEMPTTTQPTSKSKEGVIRGGFWYLYDEDNVICYVFSFKGEGNVDLAMFDDSNISGEDAKYFTGYSTYTIDGDTVRMEHLPNAFLQKSFDLVIDGNNLKYDGKNLAHHDNLTIDYAIGFKMASSLKNMNNQ